ncbi:endo-1,4-beta-xylanase [Sphingomonas guangdongensis]|uniref:Beta-xylanase n=1 Tax=Sphingomonas guangdongensis TaxID=1141890 RepID=A0A285QZS8_9SPHN|nr:endo-1,4-beta-xylanase [Sphingomonas guangdongensis]SOB87410.1 endo-1,4-beta-xylanase [Sphingomonas guangdongensis]
MDQDSTGSLPYSRRRALGTGALLLAGVALPACGSAGQAASAQAGADPQQPVAAPTPSPTPEPSAGLQAIARTRNLTFGSCVAWGTAGADRGSFANPAYAALLERDCGILVPENEMKWQAIRPSADRFDFTRFDAIVDFARAKNMAVRGHTLLWHYDKWFPAWLNDYDYGSSPRAEAERLLATHIRTVTERYETRIRSYDVVNEAVDPATGALRQTSLSRAMGSAEAVLDHAFRTARTHAPHAELVYNDYMSWEAGNEQHRAGVLRLLQGFKARGVPVDALGIQSHIALLNPTPSVPQLVAQLSPAWRQFLDQVVALGYRLVVTEFDVRDKGLPAAVPARDAGVAEFARAYVDLMLSYPQLGDFLVWGMSDRYSWLRGFEPRADGEITRGCPYDIDFQPKPLRAALAAALAAAPARPARTA